MRYVVAAGAGIVVAYVAVRVIGGTHHDGSTGTEALNVPFGRGLVASAAVAGALLAYLTKRTA
jgi:hypothetical protein